MQRTKFRSPYPRRLHIKSDFLRVFIIYGRGGHLDQHHVYQTFISLYLKAFLQNLDQDEIVVSEKIRFDFLYVQDLGPKPRNDIDLQYSQTFINSNRCLLLPTFRPLAAVVSEKSSFTFSYGKAQITKFDLAVK